MNNKKIKALVLTILTACVSTGCAGKTEVSNGENATKTNVEKGYYKEKVLETPQKTGEDDVVDLFADKSGGVYLTVEEAETGNAVLWKKEKSAWKKLWESETVKKVQQSDAEKQDEISVTKDGDYVLASKDGEKLHLFYCDQEGNIQDKKELALQKEYGDWNYYALDDKGGVLKSKEGALSYVASDGGGCIPIVEEGDTTTDWEYEDGMLYILTYKDVIAFDTQKQEKEKPPVWLQQVLKQSQNDNAETVLFAADPGGAKNQVYCADHAGITKLEGKQATTCVDGAHVVMGDEQGWCHKFLRVGSSFYFLHQNDETQTFDIYSYSYQDKKPQQQLTIYSLYASSELEQLVRAYQRENPDVEVQIDVGIQTEGIGVTDALNKLNTKLATGEGPDLLLLDGIQIENYQKKQMLLDVSEDIKKVEEQEPCFDSILHTYEKDNAVYAIPTRFALAYAVAKEPIASDTAGLAKQMKSYKEKTPEVAAFWAYDYQKMADVWYHAIMAESGAKQEERIRQYLSDMIQIHDLVDMKEIDKEEAKLPSKNDVYAFGYGLYQDIVGGVADVAVDYLTDVEDWRILQTLQDENKVQYSYLQEDGKDIYIPELTLGISAKSKHVDAAKEFLKFALSQDAQLYLTTYFPTNQNAFESLLKTLKKESVTVEADLGGMTSSEKVKVDLPEYSDDAIQIWKERFSTLSKPVVSDVMTRTIVLEGLDRIITKQDTLEAAEKKVSESIKLYEKEME